MTKLYPSWFQSGFVELMGRIEEDVAPTFPRIDTASGFVLDRKCLGNSVFVLFVALTQQKMSITLFLTALHIPQSEIGFLPFSGDRPLLCLLSSDYMIPHSLPSFCMNVLHTGLAC